eukprot:2946783-Rhodomonas_salina.2
MHIHTPQPQLQSKIRPRHWMDEARCWRCAGEGSRGRARGDGRRRREARGRRGDRGGRSEDTGRGCDVRMGYDGVASEHEA